MESPSLKFKALQEEIRQLLAEQQLDDELIHKKMTRYIALMVEENGDQQERMFDYFCEYGGVDLLTKLMRGDPLLAVKCYSLLFINLKNEMWTSFILCQPFLVDAISLRAHSADQQYTEYFVSFLKSLSIRINQSQVTLFFNKRNCTFPLAMAAMHYHNHPDFMVRTSVMNIVLQLMKIQEPKTQLYFSRFPFTSYLVAFTCEVSRLATSLYAKLGDPTLTAKQMTSYKVDLADYLYYFNDLVQHATPTAIQVVEHIVAAYYIVPTFNRLLRQDPKDKMYAFLLLHQGLRVIKSRNILDTIATLLLKPQISIKTLQRIQKFQKIVVPDVFKKEFDPAGSYWGQYEPQLIGHCLEVFKDIEKFDVSYEQGGKEGKDKFEEQVGKISSFIGYDLLKGEVMGSRLQEEIEEGEEVSNPFKVVLLQLLSPSLTLQHVLGTTFLLNIANNPNVSPRVLQMCQFKPLETKKQNLQKESDSSIKLTLDLKKMIIECIQQLNWDQISVAALSNTLRLLKQILVENEQIEFQEELLRNYREVTNSLREYAKQEHMKILVDNCATREAQIRQIQSSNQWEISLPFPPFYLPQDRWDEAYEDFSLPTKPNQRIVHLTQHFFLFRSFINHYFTKFYEAEYPSFEEEYTSTFLATRQRWKKGETYFITGRTLNMCQLEGSDKKLKKAMIIEDQFSFVLGELYPEGCRILVNQPWKNMTFEISREEGTCVQASLGTGKSRELYRLFFESQVRSGATLVRLNDVKWQSSQFQLSFINKFLKAAAEQ